MSLPTCDTLGRLGSRITETAGDPGPVLNESGRPCRDVVGPIAAGTSVAEVAREYGLPPLDIVAAIAREALGPDSAEGPSLTQARAGWSTPRGIAESAWAELLPDRPRKLRLALAAGLLQVIDFWDPSHDAAQEADDLGEPRFSIYWHAIAHRREPDFGNAGYWFRRVGRDPIHRELPEVVDTWAPRWGIDPEALARAGVIAGDTWDSFGFLDLCRAGVRESDSQTGAIARHLQRLEMAALLDATAAAAIGTD